MNASLRALPAFLLATAMQYPALANDSFVHQRVLANDDDAEEAASDGSMNLNSADLELIQDGSEVQVVGIRIQNVSIAQGTPVRNAYLEFTTDEVSAGACSLTIQAHDTNNSGPFVSTVFNISNRVKTTASVVWNPAPWTVIGAAGPEQRTPDLSAIIQEIVDRPGWTAGNAITFIITGSGRRTATAYESGSGTAPLLHVEEVGGPTLLGITPSTATTFDLVTLTHCGGVPGNPILLFVMQVNGAPFVSAVTRGTFDAQGIFALTGAVPDEPGLPGNTLTLQGITIDHLGKLVLTSAANLAIF